MCAVLVTSSASRQRQDLKMQFAKTFFEDKYINLKILVFTGNAVLSLLNLIMRLLFKWNLVL